MHISTHNWYLATNLNKTYQIEKKRWSVSLFYMIERGDWRRLIVLSSLNGGRVVAFVVAAKWRCRLMQKPGSLDEMPNKDIWLKKIHTKTYSNKYIGADRLKFSTASRSNWTRNTGGYLQLKYFRRTTSSSVWRENFIKGLFSYDVIT